MLRGLSYLKRVIRKRWSILHWHDRKRSFIVACRLLPWCHLTPAGEKSLIWLVIDPGWLSTSAVERCSASQPTLYNLLALRLLLPTYHQKPLSVTLVSPNFIFLRQRQLPQPNLRRSPLSRRPSRPVTATLKACPSVRAGEYNRHHYSG